MMRVAGYKLRVTSFKVQGACFARRAFLALLLVTCTLYLATAHAHAQNPARDQPLEITADHTLEWHRNTQQYIARGNVVAQQGDVTIMADTLTADYHETGAAAFEIYRLTAAGNVRITSQGNTAIGTNAVYDVDSGTAVMTGDNLSLASPDQTVTARDSLEYFVTEGRLTARGNATVIRGEDRMVADTASAVFTEDATGARRLNSLSAEGNVRIVTPTEVLTGRRGVYTAATNIAAISGDVKITRGPNVLEGERAEVNLTTNVSRMLGDPAGGGRVRGVFFPNSAGQPDNREGRSN